MLMFDIGRERHIPTIVIFVSWHQTPNKMQLRKMQANKKFMPITMFPSHDSQNSNPSLQICKSKRNLSSFSSQARDATNPTIYQV